MEKVDESKLILYNGWIEERINFSTNLITDYFNKSKLQYSILRLEVDGVTYNYSLLIWNGFEHAHSNLAILDSEDGEYLPYFEKYSEAVRNAGIEYYKKIKEFVENSDIQLLAFHYPIGSDDLEYMEDYKIKVLTGTLITRAYLIKQFGENFSFRETDEILRVFPMPDMEKINERMWFQLPQWIHPTTETFIVKPIYIRCGLKLIPMPEISLLTLNPLFHPAAEIWVNLLCNALMIKSISGAFCTYYGNKMINKTDVGMFQNLTIHNKYKRSELVKSGESEAEFPELIKYTNKVLIIATDFIGIAPRYLRNDNSFKDMLNCKILLFDMLYALYTLSLNGVLHNDLHLKNVTLNLEGLPNNKMHINRYRVPYNETMTNHLNEARKYSEKENKPNIIRGLAELSPALEPEIDPKDDMTFLAYTFGLKFYIIDFSRAIIFHPHASCFQKYRAEAFRYRAHVSIDSLVRFIDGDRYLPVDASLRTYIKKNVKKLKDVAFEDPELAWKFLQLLDVMMFCRNWHEAHMNDSIVHKMTYDIYRECIGVLEYRLMLLETDKYKLVNLYNPMPAIFRKYFKEIMIENFWKQKSFLLETAHSLNVMDFPLPIFRDYRARAMNMDNMGKYFGTFN